jgi:hypothetical protein
MFAKNGKSCAVLQIPPNYSQCSIRLWFCVTVLSPPFKDSLEVRVDDFQSPVFGSLRVATSVKSSTTLG